MCFIFFFFLSQLHKYQSSMWECLINCHVTAFISTDCIVLNKSCIGASMHWMDCVCCFLCESKWMQLVSFCFSEVWIYGWSRVHSSSTMWPISGKVSHTEQWRIWHSAKWVSDSFFLCYTGIVNYNEEIMFFREVFVVFCLFDLNVWKHQWRLSCLIGSL